MDAEYIPVNKRARNIALVLLVIYFSFIINIEFIVNFFMSFIHTAYSGDIESTTQYVELKIIVQTILLVVPSIIFFSYLSWVCFLVVRFKALPPKDMAFPFGMNKVFGREALFLGYIGVIVSVSQVFVKLYEIYKMYELVNQ